MNNNLNDTKLNEVKFDNFDDETDKLLEAYYDDLEFWPVNEYYSEDYDEMAEYFSEDCDQL
jgi:hypothetical protein